MSTSEKSQKKVKERVWKKLTAGLDPDNDPMECIDDIKDNTSYAIDVTIFETGRAIFKELWGDACIDCSSITKVRRFKSIMHKWLVPVCKPEPNLPDSMPVWIEDTPTVKEAAEEVDEIFASIEGMRISNRGNVGIGSGKSKENHLPINEQKKQKQDEKRIRGCAYE